MPRAPKDRTVLITLLTVGGSIIIALIAIITPAGQDWLKSHLNPAPAPHVDPPKVKRTKHGLCNDPRTNQPYSFDIPSFYPKQYTHLDQPFGGDAANPGHKFYLPNPVEAPGFVLAPPGTHCRHDGTHEEITYCGPLRSALGQPTKFAEIEGWINGEGGPTYMTVAYQMPCEIPNESN